VTIRIKICGITHPDDAAMVADAGADLIGLNFVPESQRQVDSVAAAEIADCVAGRVERVGVFRNSEPDEIARVLRRVDLARLQFHGEEPEEGVEEVDLPVIKAIRGADLDAANAYPGTILLLDHPTQGGGAGKQWQWSDASLLIERGHDVILAGGLDPDNVGRVLSDLGDLLPWGVDVATGVEGADHRKDPEKLARFVEAVRRAETAE
jgi:phosphoribosylanthranilate isomerase